MSIACLGHQDSASTVESYQGSGFTGTGIPEEGEKILPVEVSLFFCYPGRDSTRACESKIHAIGMTVGSYGLWYPFFYY